MSLAGATAVRLLVSWGSVAPAVRPANFDATDPSDPAYDWSSTDALVVAAVAAGLDPILCILNAPAWAGGTANEPSPSELGRFATAAATRYDGHFGGLPRVRYFQVWNEPNLAPNLVPQRVGSSLVSPVLYRMMVNAFSGAVHRAVSDDLVIAGGLAPYAATTGPGIPPLTFMREFLCLSGARIRPRPNCLERASFDIWAMQPYTWGGPTHQATIPGDLALGDLPQMKSLLDGAYASGKIIARQAPEFWVTEFSYDTNPPDPGGVSLDLQARWTSESLYRMWQSGVSLVTWFLLRDQPFPARWQSGLYFNGGAWADDQPKPTFEAFRFPMVAFPESGGTRVWVRVPPGASGPVTFERSVSGGWTVIGSLAPDSAGIATDLLSDTSTDGSVRARLPSGETSIPFSLTPEPDRYVNPFGD